jgi:hypothetical protein
VKALAGEKHLVERGVLGTRPMPIAVKRFQGWRIDTLPLPTLPNAFPPLGAGVKTCSLAAGTAAMSLEGSRDQENAVAEVRPWHLLERVT